MFDPQGICTVNWQLFLKINFLPILVAILNFCIKRKKTAFISETVRDRAISSKFLTCRAFPPKNRFSANFGGHLEFLCKTQKRIMSEMVRNRAISANFFTLRVSGESSGDFPQKSFSFHFWRPS